MARTIDDDYLFELVSPYDGSPKAVKSIIEPIKNVLDAYENHKIAKLKLRLAHGNGSGKHVREAEFANNLRVCKMELKTCLAKAKAVGAVFTKKDSRK